MKNKGFTLIELLGGILILTVIALITIPVISGVINKARLNSLKDSAYGLIDASNLYYAQFGVSSNTRFDKSDNENTLKELRYKGNIKEGTVIINTKGKTTICVTDGKNSAYKNYNESAVTLVSKKTCTVPSNTNIVYLDDEATLTELSNQELTDELNALKNEMASLKTKVDEGTSLNKVYPVGSIYMSMDNTNPTNLFGGTWEKIEGKFLLSSDSSFTVGSTGGNSSVSYTPTGTVGNHTLTVEEMPNHNHQFGLVKWNSDGSNSGPMASVPTMYSEVSTNNFHKPAAGTGNTNYSSKGNLMIWPTGGSQPHSHSFTGTPSNINTMPPYLVVNVWKRTA